MQDLTEAARRQLDDVAKRHGVSSDAVLTLLRALAASGGAMAQFSHPDLGGMGQWSQGGMIMVGDMFNHALKQRVDALCRELVVLLRGPSLLTVTGVGPFQSQEQSQGRSIEAGFGSSAGAWWPGELGNPASSGGQNDMRYAYFPATRRLAIQQNGRISLYDTGNHQITGVSQQQGSGGEPLAFSSNTGQVRVQDLRQVGGADGPQAAPARPGGDPVPPQAAALRSSVTQSDPLTLIQRLAELHAAGVLTTEEFVAKKAELLGRL